MPPATNQNSTHNERQLTVLAYKLEHCQLNTTIGIMFPFSSVQETLALRAVSMPHKLAVCEVTLETDNDETKTSNPLTYEQLHQSSCRLAQVLVNKHQLRRGDRLAVLLDNSSWYLTMYTACAMTGVIAVPLNSHFSSDDVAQVVQDCTPRLIITQSQFKQKVEASCSKVVESGNISITTLQQVLQDTQSAQVDSFEEDPKKVMTRQDDLQGPWVIMYTSGTSGGGKKGVVRSQQGSIAGFWSHMETMQFTKHDRYLAIWDMFGISSFFFTFMVMYLGGSCFLFNIDKTRKDLGGLLNDAICKFDITYTTAGPSYFEMMLAAMKPDLKIPLKKVLLSGAPSTVALKESIRNSWPSTKVFEIYGSTEAGIISVLCQDDPDLVQDSVGIEPAGSKPILILKDQSSDNVGEVIVNTTMMFLEYWGSPSLTSQVYLANGWFKTGDVGFKDQLGFLHLAGRRDDRLNLPSGIAMYPTKAEGVIKSHSGIHDAVLFCAKLENISQTEQLVVLIAYDCAKEQLPTMLEEIKIALADKVAQHCIPSLYMFSAPDFIPRTSNGKVIRGEAKEATLKRWKVQMPSSQEAIQAIFSTGYFVFFEKQNTRNL